MYQNRGRFYPFFSTRTAKSFFYLTFGCGPSGLHIYHIHIKLNSFILYSILTLPDSPCHLFLIHTNVLPSYITTTSPLTWRVFNPLLHSVLITMILHQWTNATHKLTLNKRWLWNITVQYPLFVPCESWIRSVMKCVGVCELTLNLTGNIEPFACPSAMQANLQNLAHDFVDKFCHRLKIFCYSGQ